MKCTEIKELLVAYVEGILEDSERQAVEEHLKDCSACQAELQELTGLHDRLVTNGKTLAQSNLEQDVMNKVIREQNTRLKTATRATEALKIRRTIMKSPMTRIAVAAVIIIAVLIGINPFSSTITFADIVKPILNAKTIICDLIIGSDESGPVAHEVIIGSRIRRNLSNLPNLTQILDLEGGQMLVLDSVSNTAIYVDIQGELQNRSQAYVKFLRQTIRLLQENADIEKLGEQTIDGQKAVGFIAKGPNESVTIWADPKTAHPIRIEAQLGQGFNFIMNNFELDVLVDESMVSMEVPDGYTLQQTGIDIGNATEEDFIESLRIWAKVLGDGVFPETIGTEATMKQMPALIEKMKAMNIPAEEGTDMGMKVGKGMMYHQILDTSGADLQYVGAGVKLGDASKPVFWYRPQGSATYRVIYGDLSVKDVAPEDLPK
jgi:hypothetical protein